MSFAFKTTQKERDGNRLISMVLREIVRAAIVEKQRSGVTQREVARRLGVDKSHVSKLLSGKSNMTLRSAGELLGAIGWEAEFRARPKHKADGNHRSTATTPSSVRFDVDNRAGVATQSHISTTGKPSARLEQYA